MPTKIPQPVPAWAPLLPGEQKPTQPISPEPLISVAMAVFNNAATLRVAVRSVLAQTEPRWELLLIDDGSADDTARIMEEFRDPRIRAVADGRRLGHGARLNQAIDLARGRTIARMDGDDVCYPERLARQAAYLEAHPEIDLLGCGALVFRNDGEPKGLFPVALRHEDICRKPWAGFHLSHPTWMGRAEWFRRYRYGSWYRAEDQDLLLRSFSESRFACLPEVLLGYRQGPLPAGKLLAARRSFVRAVFREALRRRRYGWIPLAAAAQGVKGLFESAAIAAGLENALLRHRARPEVDRAVLARWREVWSELQEQ